MNLTEGVSMSIKTLFAGGSGQTSVESKKLRLKRDREGHRKVDLLAHKGDRPVFVGTGAVSGFVLFPGPGVSFHNCCVNFLNSASKM